MVITKSTMQRSIVLLPEGKLARLFAKTINPLRHDVIYEMDIVAIKVLIGKSALLLSILPLLFFAYQSPVLLP